MSNIMSSHLVEWRDQALAVKSPVAANLASLLTNLAMYSDDQLQCASLQVKSSVWDSRLHGLEEALQLPDGGSLYRNLGFGWAEGTVNSIDLADSIAELQKNSNGSSWQATTQTEICRKAFPNLYK